MATTHSPNDNAGNSTDTATNPSTKVFLKLVGIVLALTAAVTLMLLAFLTPSFHSGAKDLPLAVSGPQDAIAEVTTMLDQKQPGAFSVTTYPGQDEVREAISHRSDIGGIVVSPDGVTVFTASGAGQPYTQVLTAVGNAIGDALGNSMGNSMGNEMSTPTDRTHSGTPVHYIDVAPTTTDDPTAGGLSVLALPLAFGGMISAVLLSVTMKARYGLRALGSLLFSVLAGLALAAVLQFGFGTIDGNYIAASAVLALGIAATSMLVLGLESVIGYPGIGIGAIFTLFISNPLSGIATGWQWLPSPWGSIGQYLPIGAAGNAVRSVAFFDGAGAAHSVWTLAIWILVGGLLTTAAWLRYRAAMAPVRARQTADAKLSSPDRA